MKIKDLKNKKGVFNILVIGIVLLILLNSGMIVNCSSDYITYYGLDGLFTNYTSSSVPDITVKLPLNINDYQTSSIYDATYSQFMVGMVNQRSVESYIWNHQDLDTDFFIRSLKNNLPDDVSEFSNFIVIQDVVSGSDDFSVYFYNGVIVSYGSYVISSLDGSNITVKCYDFDGTNYTFNSNYSTEDTQSFLNFGTQLNNVVYSNSAIYCSDTYISSFYDGLTYFAEHPENFKDQNYLLYDSNGNNIYNNPTITPDVYPDGSGGTSENNLYLNGAEFRYNIPVYWGIGGGVRGAEPISNWGKGSVNFTADLNQYQIANSFDFNLTYTFYVTIKGSGDYWSTSREDKNFYGKFGPYTYTQTLTDFYNHGQNKSFNVSEIFDNCTYSTSLATLPYYSVTDTLDYMGGFDEINDFEWYLDSSVVMVSDDNDKSGSLSSRYNFIDRTSTNNDTSIRNNYNPYVNEDGEPTNDTNNQTTETSNGAQLINNDNDVINFNGNGEVAQELVNDLLPEDSDAGLTQDLQETLNNNGWLPVVQSTFSFIPLGVWSTIEIYVISCLGILAAFFVLRLILDLL